MSVTTRRRAAPDGRQQHLEWLSLIDTSGPFLTLPVLTRAWPNLDAVDKAQREALRQRHFTVTGDEADFVEIVLDGLLELGGCLRRHDLDEYAMSVPEHDAVVTPDFAVVDPDPDFDEPASPSLLGLILPAGQPPTARIAGDPWPATPADRLAALCRHHEVPLGLATDGRWWALVWAPSQGVTSTAVFDAVTWNESADLVVVRAFASLLRRERFFGVPENERLPALFAESLGCQEEVTEELGKQVRRSVELLVDAVSRDNMHHRSTNRGPLDEVRANDTYWGAVVVMMRVMFLLYAEERGLLPADNDLYADAYSADRLCEALEARASAGSEEELEHSRAAWLRLLALFQAVHDGVDHPRLRLPAYDGSILDPDRFGWLQSVRVDDRTVLAMLRAVQYVQIKRERRRLSWGRGSTRTGGI